MNVVLIILPIFIVIGLGSFLKNIKLIDEAFVNISNRLIFFIFLPALLFYKISNSNVEGILKTYPLLIMFACILISFILSFSLGYLIKLKRQSLGTFVMDSIRSNMAYFGLPIAFYAYGNDGLKIASVYLAISVPLINLLSIASLEATSNRKLKSKEILENIIINPIVISCILGIIVSVTHIEHIGFIERALSIISSITLPLALINIGANIDIKNFKNIRFSIFVSSVFKLFIMPLLAYSAFYILNIHIGIIAKIIIILLASPTATVTYVLASTMNGDTDLAVGTIVLTSIISIVSFYFWLSIFGI